MRKILKLVKWCTYNSLRNRGVPLCKICDEKTYLKSFGQEQLRLAQESPLMQFGYNVNQQEGLSSVRRQKILAVLVDNNIMTRSEIISYLDFFVNQRSNQNKYGIAINKWEEDRDFISNYKVGEFTQFGIKAIYKR